MNHKKSHMYQQYDYYLNLVTHEDLMNADDVKGVTTRLCRSTRADLDTFASLAGISRQKLMEDLIHMGLREVQDAFLQHNGPDDADNQRKIYEDLQAKIYDKLKSAEVDSK